MADNEGKSPIFYASGFGHFEVVRYLIKLGADVNQQDKDGMGPLHAAAQEGHLEIVSILLSSGGQVNRRSKEGITPFTLACWKNHLDIAKFLHEKSANQKMEDNQPLLHASMEGNVDVVKYLISLGADVNLKGALSTYADRIGLAFQIADDILDQESTPEQLGKQTQKDAEAGKATFIDLMGLDGAKRRAHELVDEACSALTPFGNKAGSLQEAALFIVERKN